MARSAARKSRWLSPWMDVWAIAAWGILFLTYWANGRLYLLIHPNYMPLTVIAGIALIALAIWRAIAIVRQRRSSASNESHITLLPAGWSSTLLLVTAIAGFIITPRAFASQTALQRGVQDAPTLTRVRPQAFRGSSNPEDKSIIDWVRTLTAYPEPDAYNGQRAKVEGFVIHPDDLPPDYLLISRFVLTCCAADAYPISLPVKLAGQRDQYKPDTWLEIKGSMTSETLNGKRLLVIQAESLSPIPEPKNPYDY